MPNAKSEVGDESARDRHEAKVELGRRLRGRQLEVLYDQIPVALAASLAAAAVLVPLLWPVAPRGRLLVWVAALLIIVLLRGYSVLAYRRAGPDDRARARWLKIASAGIVASGLLWGSIIPLLAPADAPLYQGLVILWVCGLAAGSVAALSPLMVAFFAFLLPATLPGIVYLLLLGTPPAATLGGALVLFGAFLSFNALRMNRTVLHSLRLELANQELLARLAAEKAAVERLNTELESRVAHRTADLNSALEAKSRFLSATSHDLRQPLQMLSLLQGTLALKALDPEVRGLVDRMGSGLRSTASMLDALSEIARLERGGLAQRIHDVPVGPLIAGLAEEIGPSARSKGLRLRVVKSRAAVRSDERLLECILRNLLSNAVKYTRAGGVLIGARRNGSNLRLEVWDTGIGIAPEHLGRIFEELYRVDGIDDRRDSSQGLGLAIAERTARFLGHPLTVRSTPGKGSVFAVIVPRADGSVLRSGRMAP
jgi:signal transduction histidine kinase